MSAAQTFTQAEFDTRCEWGEQGVAQLAPGSDAVIVVDVLSFSTSVEMAVSRGATIFPYRGPADGVATYAGSVEAEWADRSRSSGRHSLSPHSMLQIKAGTRLVLPSPNGSTLSLAAAPVPVLAGCLRNAQAVARAACHFGPRIAVIPAGERWRGEGTLRPSLEDWLGAGAIISTLSGSLSPEARSAAASFSALAAELASTLEECASGKELIERGFAEDVALAAALNVSEAVPLLVEGAFTRWRP